MRITNTLSALTLLAAIMLPQTAISSPVIKTEANGRVKLIVKNEPLGATLDTLASHTGFTISGKLEQPARQLEGEFSGKLETVIKRLVSPQSLAIIYTTSSDGKTTIKTIELLPTGKNDTDFSLQYPDAPYTGSPERIQKRLEHEQRRGENRAQRMQDGSMVWTEEGRRKLKERFDKLEIENKSRKNDTE